MLAVSFWTARGKCDRTLPGHARNRFDPAWFASENGAPLLRRAGAQAKAGECLTY
jgi:hypothetical protein